MIGTYKFLSLAQGLCPYSPDPFCFAEDRVWAQELHNYYCTELLATCVTKVTTLGIIMHTYMYMYTFEECSGMALESIFNGIPFYAPRGGHCRPLPTNLGRTLHQSCQEYTIKERRECRMCQYSALNACGESCAWNANYSTTISKYVTVYNSSITEQVYREVPQLLAFQACDTPHTFTV